MNQLSQELERVNGNLRLKVEENNSLENRVRSLQQEIDGLRRGGSEFEFKLQEYQSTISSLEGRLKSANQENDELRRRLGELSDVNRKVAEY